MIEQLRRTSVPTSLTEKQVLQRLQTLLKMPNFLERYLSDLPKREKETPGDFARRKESYIAQMAEGLSLETEAGVFGPATQKAFEKLLKFMDKEVSLTIMELNKLQLELPAGCPLPLPSNIAQRPITPDYYRAQVSAGKLVFAGSIDSDKIPVLNWRS